MASMGRKEGYWDHCEGVCVLKGRNGVGEGPHTATTSVTQLRTLVAHRGLTNPGLGTHRAILNPRGMSWGVAMSIRANGC